MGGLEGLGISLPTLIAQIVNFAVLFGLLYLVAYKPIMRLLDERSGKIKASMEQTELIRQQAERAEQATKKQIEAARKDGREIVAKAVKAGEEVRQQTQQQAREEAESLLGRARAEIQRERDEAIAELRKEFADLTIMAAEKVIARSLDKKAHREIIDRVLAESTALKKG
ncbi:MAG: F0F1 ATP synthase subunit B [Chloroflexota bacterium]